MKLLTILITLAAGAMLAAAPLNVKDFGAVGDGITDDTAAIQRAFDAIDAHSRANREIYVNDYGRIPSWGVYDGPNQELFFPAGEYRITGTIVGEHAFTLTGEEGSVIFTENKDLLMFYFWPAYRISLRNLAFKGGRTHVFFSTNNMDVMSFVAENCRFENSSYFALDSGNYQSNANSVGPWSITRDENGLAVLEENTLTGNLPNSTKYIVSGCEFFNCAGASKVVSDGPFISKCTFISELPQQLPVFYGSFTGAIYDCTITANIPEDFQEGIITNAGNLNNIIFSSTSGYGAPLLQWLYSKELNHPLAVTVENCVSASANSNKDDAIVWCAYAPSQLKMTNNYEANGNYCNAVHFENVPADDAGLVASYPHPQNPNIIIAEADKTHSFLLTDNGKEMDTSLPDIYNQFLTADTTSAYAATFPTPESVLAPIDISKCNILDAADFGIGYEDSPEDIANLQKLFDEAAKTENPLVRLPGRKFIVSEPLTVPAKCVIRADGRTVFHAAKDTNGIFKVSGDDIELEIIGLLFNGGTNSIEITGAGTARFNDCIFYDNRTAILNRQTGEEKLLTEVFASSVYSPVFVENYDGEFRFIDGWISMQATLDRGACLRNFGNGVMVCRNVCGVPVIFGYFSAGHGKDLPDWPYGHDVFWFENHGTLRTSHFRYGAEFDGAPGIINRGCGRIYVEGAYISYWYPTGPHIFLRNESSDGQFGMSNPSSFGAITPAGSAFCEGVEPGIFLYSNYQHTDYLLFRDENGNKSQMYNTIK